MGLRGAGVFPFGGIRPLCRTAGGHLAQFTEFPSFVRLTPISRGRRDRLPNWAGGINESKRSADVHWATAVAPLTARPALPCRGDDGRRPPAGGARPAGHGRPASG